MTSDPTGYREIADALRDQIRAGVLSSGQRMLSEAELAQTHGVAKLTARRAMEQLRREGLVVGERGRQPRVRGPIDQQQVTIPRGADFEIRMPTPAEARELHIGEGVPILVATFGDPPQMLVYRGGEWSRFRVR